MWWLLGCLTVGSEATAVGTQPLVLKKANPAQEQEALGAAGAPSWVVSQFGKNCAGQVLVEQRSRDGRQLTFLATNRQSFTLYLVDEPGTLLRWACDVERTGEASTGIVEQVLKTVSSRKFELSLPDPTSPPAVVMLVRDQNQAPDTPLAPGDPAPTGDQPAPNSAPPVPGSATPSPNPTTPPEATGEPPAATSEATPAPPEPPTPTVAPVLPGGLSAPQ